MITQQELKARLSYDPDTGVFTHLKNVGLKAGSIANCLNAKGYVVVRLQRKLYYAHRLAVLYMTGVWPKDQIDHINGVCVEDAAEAYRAAKQQLHTFQPTLR